MLYCLTFYSVAVLLEHTLLQLLRGIEAHLLLTVIHRCNLDDNGKVTAGLYRNGQARNRDIEDGVVWLSMPRRSYCLPSSHGSRLMTSSTFSVILIAPIPKIRRTSTMPMPRSSIKWRITSGAVPTSVLSDTRLISTASSANQTVAALYQLDRGLGLADTGVTEQKHAFAVDFDEYAVQRNTRCKFYLEEGDDHTHDGRGKLVGTEDRHTMLLCSRKAFRKYVNIAREQQHRDAGLEQTVETAAALLARQTLYITGLNLAHDLDTVRIEIIKKSCQLQTGTVYVVLGDLGLFKASGP